MPIRDSTLWRGKKAAVTKYENLRSYGLWDLLSVALLSVGSRTPGMGLVNS